MRDKSEVKRIDYSFRGLVFESQDPCEVDFKQL